MNIRFDNWVNLATTIVCVFLLIVLLIGTTARKRTLARAGDCADNLRAIGLAIHNYHAAYKQLPQSSGGTTGNENPQWSNAGRLGPLVALTPFVEQQSLWETIANPYENKTAKKKFPPMGPVPWFDETVYVPWGSSPQVYLCPDNFPPKPAGKVRVVKTLESEPSAPGVMSSYVACFGDGTSLQGRLFDEDDAEGANHWRAACRGMFVTGREMKFRDVLDGLSNTICFSETVASVKRSPGRSEIFKDVNGLSLDPSLCLKASKQNDAAFWEFGRGSRWCDGAVTLSGFQTVLPPNSPSCTSERGFDDPVVSAKSLHPGGVFVLMGDGAVVFLSENIDSGDASTPGVSHEKSYSPPGSKNPYGLWGALGSRAARENIAEAIPNIAPAVPPRRAQEDDPDRTRVWTDNTGKIRLRAAFVEIIDKKLIRLEDMAGVIHEVPLNTLSARDIYRAVEMDMVKRQRR